MQCFFLHLHNNLPVTSGGVTQYLLCRIIGVEGEVVHFVSVRYITQTIRDCKERLDQVLSSIVILLQGVLEEGQVTCLQFLEKPNSNNL